MKKKKSTRILALAGIILLAAMYASTLLFALMDSPAAKGLFGASIFCTIAVPVLLYGMILTARALRGRGQRDEEPHDEGLHDEGLHDEEPRDEEPQTEEVTGTGK